MLDLFKSSSSVPPFNLFLCLSSEKGSSSFDGLWRWYKTPSEEGKVKTMSFPKAFSISSSARLISNFVVNRNSEKLRYAWLSCANFLVSNTGPLHINRLSGLSGLTLSWYCRGRSSLNSLSTPSKWSAWGCVTTAPSSLMPGQFKFHYQWVYVMLKRTIFSIF